MGAPLAPPLAELLRRSGALVESEVTGNSMEPAVPAGATARIRCDGAAATGEVVALRLGGVLTIHRVVHIGRSKRASGWLITHGDNNYTCDAPVPARDLIGRVVALRRSGGTWAAPGPARPHARVRAALTRLVELAMIRALEIHPSLARAAKGCVVIAMAPLVSLRPYPAGQQRRASIAHRA